MKKAHLAGSIVATLIFCSSAPAENVTQLVENYKSAGQAIVDMVNSQSVSVDQIEAKVLDLTKASVELANLYKQAHPDGTQLLDVVITQVANVDNGAVTGVGPMVELSFDEIEGQWHDLGYFESNDSGVDLEDEDNEHFTDPLHVMIHPIMVLRAAKDFSASNSPEDLNAMKSEMEEGLEQVAIVGDMLE